MSRCSNYGMPHIIVKGGTERKKRANEGDAKDVIQEERERRQSADPMTDKGYLQRMNEVCRDCHDAGGQKSTRLLKARLLDMEHRKEMGI